MLETSGNLTKGRYLRGGGLVAQVIDLSLFFYLLNAHGDVVQRVGPNGEATPEYEYDVFGNQRKEPLEPGHVPPPDTDPNPFRYCGEYYDAERDEIYLRNRSYNPANGRFTQQDKARSGSNWYSYCAGNPVTRVDPSGNWWQYLGSDRVWVPDPPGGKKSENLGIGSDTGKPAPTYIGPTPGGTGSDPGYTPPPSPPAPSPVYDDVAGLEVIIVHPDIIHVPNREQDFVGYVEPPKKQDLNQDFVGYKTPNKSSVLGIGGDTSAYWVDLRNPLGTTSWTTGSGWGVERPHGPHKGVDFYNGAPTLGAPLYSAWYGEIVSVDNQDDWADYGRYVIIKLDEDIYGPDLYIVLQHMGTVAVSEGVTVWPGASVGTVGNTGGTGAGGRGTGRGDAHLHVEVLVGGPGRDFAVDPAGSQAVDMMGRQLFRY